MQRELGLDRFLVINDFTALALSLPALSRGPAAGRRRRPRSTAPLGAARGRHRARRVGAAARRCRPARSPLDGEGGHVTLPAADEREEGVVGVLRRASAMPRPNARCPARASKTCTGRCARCGGAARRRAVGRRHHARGPRRSDARCVETIALFFGFLGTRRRQPGVDAGRAAAGSTSAAASCRASATRIARSRSASASKARAASSRTWRRIPAFVVQAKVSPGLTGAARALDEL